MGFKELIENGLVSIQYDIALSRVDISFNSVTNYYKNTLINKTVIITSTFYDKYSLQSYV